MKQVILIHGLPDKEEVLNGILSSAAHWFPWIQQQLTQQGILSQAPEMPRSYDPVYVEHEQVLNQMEISDETILAGHSCGGGFLLRYLSEHSELSPKKVILVAPWLDPEGYLKGLNPDSDYFDFTIDPTLSERIELHCMYSTDDEQNILDSVDRIQKELPNIIMHVFSDKGHFTEPDLGTKEFPELLELILKS
ncbi:MAG: alpha/beta hydrolase [Candidatus Pacebacteria bacterium]|nr:alpha/beta hydrolase [Candidatus Paceibacterota bacterium]